MPESLFSRASLRNFAAASHCSGVQHALQKQLPINKRYACKDISLEKLRRLLATLVEHWERYTTFFQDAELTWTNNLTEQMIGKFKIRAI